MKQWALGTRMYLQDYDDTVVPCYLYSMTVGKLSLQWWPDLLNPYVKNDKVWLCPDWSIPVNGNPAYRAGFDPGEGPNKKVLKMSCVCNNWHYWPNGEKNPAHLLGAMGVNRVGLSINSVEAEIQRPADLIMALDGYWAPAGWPETNSPVLHDYRNKEVRGTVGTVRGVVNLRHSGGFNAFFADGHARFMKETKHENWLKDPDAKTGDPSDLAQYR
jgi:prepilin-type processing-associated H-X9-DG protein